MEQTKFRIGRKFVRGERKGKYFTETINLKETDIYNFLWDVTELYEKGRCDFVIEWHRKL